MSFNTAVSSSTTLTFAPSRIDLTWDGASNGTLRLRPGCADAFIGLTSTYTISVLHVFPEAGIKRISAGYAPQDYAHAAGSPFKTDAYPTAATAAPFVIGHTVFTTVDNIDEVAFDLNPLNTNYTATLDSIAEYQTMQSSYYSWQMTRSVGGESQIVAFGKIARIPPNPYGDTPSGALVSAKTAFFCIG